MDGQSDRWTVITRRRMDGGGLGRGTIAVEGGARTVTARMVRGLEGWTVTATTMGGEVTVDG